VLTRKTFYDTPQAGRYAEVRLTPFFLVRVIVRQETARRRAQGRRSECWRAASRPHSKTGEQLCLSSRRKSKQFHERRLRVLIRARQFFVASAGDLWGRIRSLWPTLAALASSMSMATNISTRCWHSARCPLGHVHPEIVDEIVEGTSTAAHCLARSAVAQGPATVCEIIGVAFMEGQSCAESRARTLGPTLVSASPLRTALCSRPLPRSEIQRAENAESRWSRPFALLRISTGLRLRRR
jgi:hypothetical protein